MSIGPSAAAASCGECPRRGDVHDIDRTVQRTAPKRAYLVGRLVGLCTIVQMAERDVRPFGCECERRGPSDATRPAGDQRHLILQFHFAVSPWYGAMLHREGLPTKVLPAGDPRTRFRPGLGAAERALPASQ